MLNKNFKSFLTFATAVGLAVIAISTVPANAESTGPAGVSKAASEDVIGGTFVDQTVHELPVPDVAMASDGRSLIIWNDAGPESTNCQDSNDSCDILGVIVEADGSTVGTPFVLASGIQFKANLTSPSAVWNDDRDEWLVLLNGLDTGVHHVYAQRVSSSGELSGALVTLPSYKATTISNRDTVVNLPDENRRRHPEATWSSKDQVYLVTWHAETAGLSVGDATALGANATQTNFGYFMTGDLVSADGVAAAFVIQDTTDNGFGGLTKQAYSPTLDQWAFFWGVSGGGAQARLVTLSFDNGSINRVLAKEVADGSNLGYGRAQMSGDVIWVEPLNSWVVSWNAGENNPNYETGEYWYYWSAYARTVSPGGSLGDPARVTEFGLTRHDTPPIWLYSHHLIYDASSDAIYGTGHVESLFRVNDTTSLYPKTSALWSFDAETLEPIGWVELIAAPQEVATSAAGEIAPTSASSRSRITGIDGGIAVVYQNWPNGEFISPAEVRYHLIKLPGDDSGTDGSEEGSDDETAALPDTGAPMGMNLLTLSLLLMGLGLVAMVRKKGTEFSSP